MKRPTLSATWPRLGLTHERWTGDPTLRGVYWQRCLTSDLDEGVRFGSLRVKDNADRRSVVCFATSVRRAGSLWERGSKTAKIKTFKFFFTFFQILLD